ncbi:hypothetical protein GJ496_002926 [Pomphorhynchus laevis]|nr:hypothetical protein GJ496_002926 [Pomphorhynchus laevis]
MMEYRCLIGWWMKPAKLVVANTNYAVVRYPDTRESFVSLRDVAPGNAELTTSSNAYNGMSNQSNDTTNEDHIQDILSDQKMNNKSINEEDSSYLDIHIMSRTRT